MNGPPGAGKSMLAQRLPSILPPLSAARAARSLDDPVGRGPARANGALSDRRPFRAPHHSASMAALVGGGLNARPGEVSLAHHGVLFLDELPEFQPQVLDSPAPAARNRRGADRAGQPPRHLSGPLPARRGHEPLPLRPGDGARLRLPPAAERALHGAVPGPALRAAARPHRPRRSRCRPSRAADLILPPPAEGSAEVAARVAAARELPGQALRRPRPARRHHQRRLPGAAARGGRQARRRRA